MIQANNMSTNHVISMNGESHTLSEWCRIKGIPEQRVRQRIYKGMNDVDALTKPVSEQIAFDYNGESHPLKDWSQIAGINYHTLYNRINVYHWSFEEAIGVKPHER